MQKRTLILFGISVVMAVVGLFLAFNDGKNSIPDLPDDEFAPDEREVLKSKVNEVKGKVEVIEKTSDNGNDSEKTS